MLYKECELLYLTNIYIFTLNNTDEYVHQFIYQEDTTFFTSSLSVVAPLATDKWIQFFLSALLFLPSLSRIFF